MFKVGQPIMYIYVQIRKITLVYISLTLLKKKFCKCSIIYIHVFAKTKLKIIEIFTLSLSKKKDLYEALKNLILWGTAALCKVL